MKITSKRSGHGALGFPEAGGEPAFELAPGESKELSDAHWATLSENAGVKSLVDEGAIDVLTSSVEDAAQPPSARMTGEDGVLVGIDEDTLPPIAEAAGITPEPEAETTKPEHHGRKSRR